MEDSKTEIERQKDWLKAEYQKLEAERNKHLEVAQERRAKENDPDGLNYDIRAIERSYRPLLDDLMQQFVHLECLVPRKGYLELIPATHETYYKAREAILSPTSRRGG